jgi:lantibiotic modifying enzyme
MLNPSIGDGLVRVIGRCLEPAPSRRYLSMAALDRALAEIAEEEPPAPVPFGAEPAIKTDPERCAAFAHRLGDSICAAAQPAPGEAGLAWATTHPMGGGLCSRDVNTGNAGTLLALAELVAAFGDAGHRAVLAESVRWLVQAPPLEGHRLPGLYVGEAGIGAALLRAGQVLRDPALLAAAVERGRLVRSLPYVSPDLFNGAAGRLRFHLLLWDETGEVEHLLAAAEAGEALLASAEMARAGGLCWRIPAGYEGLSDTVPLGYAHGAAGIADALLDLAEATGDGRYLATARGVARWLAGQAVPVLEDGSGIGWPSVPDGDLAPPWWCHGAAGIGSFFLHAAKVDLLAEAEDLALGAARAVVRGGRWLGPVQCHGLAGSIEFLLDVYQSLGEPSFLNEAQTLALLLGAFAIEEEGLLLWPSEWRSVVTPDYMVGYAGVALCLLRLSEPERRPRQLSRQGFRWQVGRD